ncbi:unnamed protein product [Linum trigynum]|uniref:Uncharacterized protein n=1 Tax=Linum trigynum TaxID=586398 RepID=A0AAV2CE78_9ROSI
MKSWFHPNRIHIYPSLDFPPKNSRTLTLLGDLLILLPDEQRGVDSSAPQSVNIRDIGRGEGMNIFERAPSTPSGTAGREEPFRTATSTPILDFFCNHRQRPARVLVSSSWEKYMMPLLAEVSGGMEICFAQNF